MNLTSSIATVVKKEGENRRKPVRLENFDKFLEVTFSSGTSLFRYYYVCLPGSDTIQFLCSDHSGVYSEVFQDGVQSTRSSLYEMFHDSLSKGYSETVANVAELSFIEFALLFPHCASFNIRI